MVSTGTCGQYRVIKEMVTIFLDFLKIIKLQVILFINKSNIFLQKSCKKWGREIPEKGFWKYAHVLKYVYGKQFSKEHHALNMVFRLINAQKFQISFKQCNIIWSQLSGTYLHNGQWITCIYSFLYEHKKTLAQMVSFEFCVIFEYTFFAKLVWVAAIQCQQLS